MPSAGSSGSNNGRDGSGSTGPVPCKVWAGAADGSLSVCSDVTGSGVLEPAGWRVLRVEGLTGGRCRCSHSKAHAAGADSCGDLGSCGMSMIGPPGTSAQLLARGARCLPTVFVLLVRAVRQVHFTAAAVHSKLPLQLLPGRLSLLAPAHHVMVSPSIPVTSRGAFVLTLMNACVYLCVCPSCLQLRDACWHCPTAAGCGWAQTTAPSGCSTQSVRHS